MVVRSVDIATVNCINNLKLFSNDKLFVLVVCSVNIPNSMFLYDVLVELMNIHEKKCTL